MNSIASLLFVLIEFASFVIVSSNNASTNSSNWAVLIAGSNGYYNYRHQADIAHAYQILTKLGGFPKENIIVMMYNDIVDSSYNPFPGQLFNEPGGVNVYNDINVSYSEDQVNTKNFLNVIQGIKEGDTAYGPVLESKSTDNVFIYYSDHGANGLVAMPTGEPLYADELNMALKNMQRKGMYSQLVFYLEACESGSMFDATLANDTSIFATTAATADQPSYAYYYNDTLSTYMADEYSIRWMQDSTNNWDSYESLIQQYKNVANIVKESQPQQYGDDSFEAEAIEDFEAFQDRKGDRRDMMRFLKKSVDGKKVGNVHEDYNKEWVPSTLAVSSRDVKLSVLQHRYLEAKGVEERIIAAALVEEEIEYRLSVDLLFDELVKEVLMERVYAEPENMVELTEEDVHAIKYGYIPVQNYQCLKYVYSKYEENCERFSDYSLQYVKTLVNLCELFDDAKGIEETMIDLCG